MNRQHCYKSGMAAFNAGRYAEAIEHLTPMASGSRGATATLSRFYLSQAHYHLGVDLFEQHHFAEASEHFQSASRVNPSGSSVARFLAVCYIGTGQFELAISEFESMLKQDPSNSEVRVRLALTHWRRGDPMEAMSLLQEGIYQFPNDAELLYQLGAMYASDEQIADAEPLFARAIDINPRHARALERLAQCCSVTNRHERAFHYLQLARDADPGNARIAWQLSLLAPSLVDKGYAPLVDWKPKPRSTPEDEEAIDRLSEAVLREPDFIEGLLSVPESDVDQEVFSVLTSALERSLAKHPEYADLHFHCGESYRRLGKADRAIDHVERAVEINPKYLNALILLARLYGDTDRCLDAIDRLEQAIEAGADYPDVHFLLGQLACRGGRLDRAQRAYERAVHLKNDYREALEALDGLTASSASG